MTLPRTKPVHAGNASLSSLILSMGPVGYWPMLNGSAVDESTGGTDGAFVSTGDIDFYTNPSPVNREFASSTEFGGVSGYMDSNSGASSTGSIWFIAQPSLVGGTSYVALGTTNPAVSGKRLSIFVSGITDMWTLALGEESGAISSGVVAVAGRTDIICVQWAGAGNAASLTVNTTKISTTQVGDTPTEDLYLGAQNNTVNGDSFHFPGIVSHASIFDLVITDAECNALRLTALNGA